MASATLIVGTSPGLGSGKSGLGYARFFRHIGGIESQKQQG